MNFGDFETSFLSKPPAGWKTYSGPKQLFPTCINNFVEAIADLVSSIAKIFHSVLFLCDSFTLFFAKNCGENFICEGPSEPSSECNSSSQAVMTNFGPYLVWIFSRSCQELPLGSTFWDFESQILQKLSAELPLSMSDSTLYSMNVELNTVEKSRYYQTYIGFSINWKCQMCFYTLFWAFIAQLSRQLSDGVHESKGWSLVF